MNLTWSKVSEDIFLRDVAQLFLLLSLQDSRYNDEVDQITGYKTVSLLCMPIRNADDEIVAVAQVINKTNEKGFTKDDEKVGEYYIPYII